LSSAFLTRDYTNLSQRTHALTQTNTGDTDFLPAMVRTRQKGKRVVLASMRNGCNRDILNPEAHALDMNVVWLDDHLDELIVPDATKSSLLNSGSSSPVPADVLTEIIAGILEKNGGSLKSRAVGRQLQSTKVFEHIFKAFARALHLLKALAACTRLPTQHATFV
jgi:hypothetical protein